MSADLCGSALRRWHRAADRGGPFGRDLWSRLWRRCGGAKPDAPAGPLPVESSPVGGARGRGALAIAVTALALAGFASLGSGLYLYAKAQAGQWLLHRAWTRSQAGGGAVPPWPWADTHPVARLYVPAHDVDLMVLAGASGRTLAWGPGHLDDSALPGTDGHAVVSGHRDTHFRFLRQVARGDAIVVESPDGTRREYRVRDIAIADARALALARETVLPTLTLVTCYPFDAVVPGGPQRYVVTAEAAVTRNPASSP